MVMLEEKWTLPCLRICEVGQLSNPHIQVNYFSLLASIPLRALAPTNAYFPPVPGTCIQETFRAEDKWTLSQYLAKSVFDAKSVLDAKSVFDVKSVCHGPCHLRSRGVHMIWSSLRRRGRHHA